MNAFGQYLPHFRGVFMRDSLPIKPKRNECGILNLQTSDEDGSHWVTYIKHGDDSIYYNSYGNLSPPQELIDYLGSNIKYNYEAFQSYDTVICGHLCLIFLYENCKKIFLK